MRDKDIVAGNTGGLPVRVDPLTGHVNNPWGESLGSIGKKGALFAAATLLPGLGLPGAGPAAGIPGAADGGGMNPIIWGSIIQALGMMGSQALAPQPQQWQSFSGSKTDPHDMMAEQHDYLGELRAALEHQAPLDVGMTQAPLPNDPGGRVQTPKRRALAPQTATAPLPADMGRRDGALALLRSLGTAA